MQVAACLSVPVGLDRTLGLMSKLPAPWHGLDWQVGRGPLCQGTQVCRSHPGPQIGCLGVLIHSNNPRDSYARQHRRDFASRSPGALPAGVS